MQSENIFDLIDFLKNKPFSGTLKFFGDWFGRPGDNIHYIEKAKYDVDTNILSLTFEDGESILIFSPELYCFTDEKISIKKAKKVKIQWNNFFNKNDHTKYFIEFVNYEGRAIITNSNIEEKRFDIIEGEPAFEIIK